MMDQATIDQIKGLMEWEAERTAPPEGFPHLPDLPAGRYTSQDYYDLEQKYIWKKSWLFAAHIDEVPDPGCFMKWENTGAPIIIVHGMDGVVRGFYNTCRHRGAPVVLEEKGRSPRLMGGYHNWTYKTDGELIGVPDAQDFVGLDKSCRSLIPVRCEMFGNLIFVNFDEGAMSLLDWMGPIADEWAEFQFDKIRLASRHSFELKCNWKVAMEANMEVYHVPFIHPDTVAPLVDHRRNVNTIYPNGHARMIAPGPKNSSREHMRLIDSPPEWQLIETVGELGRTCTQSYTMFPNWVSPLSSFFVPPLIFWPTSLNTTRLELITMALDWGDGPTPNLWTVDDGKQMAQVILEDTQFGEAIQKSMESDGFRSVPLSYQEARIYSFHQSCDKMIGLDNVPAHLAVEQVIGEEWTYPNDPRVAQMKRQTKRKQAA
jgi:phenylpropionate dioxygenase-like ring-hydroxylating dioxygenase large terminal subunit